MASLDILTKLTEPSIHGVHVGREILDEANKCIQSTRRDSELIWSVQPKLAFLITDNTVQLNACGVLKANFQRYLDDLESSVEGKWQQFEDLRKEMGAVIELLKNRQVMDREFQRPLSITPERSLKPHTLHDHVDQNAVDLLDEKITLFLSQLKEIVGVQLESGKAAMKEVKNIDIPNLEDISVTTNSLLEIKALLDESELTISEIVQDVGSIEHHYNQLQESIRELETQGGTLSIDDYKVLSKDTNEIPIVIAELQEALVGTKRRSEEINIRYLQYSAFFSDYKAQALVISDLTTLIDKHIKQMSPLQAQSSKLLDDIDVHLDEMWNLITWYRNFHSAYDNLVMEVHRRRQERKAQYEEVKEMRKRLDNIYMNEVEQRSIFVEKFGPFLPSDLCPAIQDPPARFFIEVEEAIGANGSDLGVSDSGGGGDANIASAVASTSDQLPSVQSHETKYSKDA